MTESNLSNVPDDIGRNDPCPCGSGKKYKKCCMRAHQVQKEAAKSSRQPHELINDATTPWDFFKLLVQVRQNNMPNLFWEMTHDEGPFRGEYPSKQKFFEAIGNGEEQMVARDGFDLARIRHDGPDVLLMLARGLDDPHLSTVTFEIVTTRPNELNADRGPRDAEHSGPRIWNVERHEMKKSEIEDEVDFGTLGYEWQPAWELGA
jgi:hypothetical protein